MRENTKYFLKPTSLHFNWALETARPALAPSPGSQSQDAGLRRAALSPPARLRPRLSSACLETLHFSGPSTVFTTHCFPNQKRPAQRALGPARGASAPPLGRGRAPPRALLGRTPPDAPPRTCPLRRALPGAPPLPPRTLPRACAPGRPWRRCVSRPMCRGCSPSSPASPPGSGPQAARASGRPRSAGRTRSRRRRWRARREKRGCSWC